MSREGVDAGHHKWLEAMKANSADALGALVTEDAVLMPPHEQPVVGRQAIIEWFAGVVRQARTTGVDVPQREVIIAGDMAIERGSFVWKVAPVDGGAEIENRGSFLAVWQRQPNGPWVLMRNIWNSTLPVPAVV